MRQKASFKEKQASQNQNLKMKHGSRSIMVWVYIGATVPQAVYLCHLEIRIFFCINVVEITLLNWDKLQIKKKLETHQNKN